VPEYTFRNKTLTNPRDLHPGDAFAIKVVAVVGYNWDWCAYQGPSSWGDQEVADSGDKLPEGVATRLFYVLADSGHTYRR